MQSEETDTCIFVHIKHASLTGRETLMIVISHTDVFVLDIAEIYTMWIALGISF